MQVNQVTLSFSLLLGVSAFAPAQGQFSQASGAQTVEHARLARMYSEQWSAGRTPQYFELLADTSGPQAVLNAAPGLQLVFMDDTGHPRFYGTDNLNAAKTISTDKVWPGGMGGLALTGANALGELAIWDEDQVYLWHDDLGANRVQILDESIFVSAHATHVAGTMIGAGTGPDAKGMSFAALLGSYDWIADLSEVYVASTQGLRVSNHSYSLLSGWHSTNGTWYWYGYVNVSPTEDHTFGLYEWVTSQFDLIACNAPYFTLVRSAGNNRDEVGPGPGGGHYYYNELTEAWEWSTVTREPDGGADGFDCIPTHATAKNIITVGAVDDIPNGYSDSSDVTMTSFSGWGPTDDGRIKPDLVANGVNVWSCAASLSGYTSMSGTSMATASISGSVNLLVQYYRSLWGADLRSSSVRALLVQSADEAGAHLGPDYRYGWGLANILTAAQLIQAHALQSPRIIEDSLSQGRLDTYYFTSDGVAPVRITLAWTDPPGTPVYTLNSATPMLVNDLDIRIAHVPSSAVYLPWTLDPSVPAATAATGDNTRDNLERVDVALPMAGDYAITVSHKATLVSPQHYSLISSHTLEFPVCLAEVTGDCDTSGTVTAADLICLVNYVFKGGVAPLPCVASGDVNCSGTLTAADVIGLVNFIFKGGAAPCDVCEIVPAAWTCE